MWSKEILEKTNRSEKRQEVVKTCEPKQKLVNIWVDGFGDILSQKNTHFASSPQVGYRSKGAGAVGGVDFNFAKYLYVGALGAYTHSNLDWKEHKGNGDVDSGYAGLYASAIGRIFYGNAAVIRSWNRYKAHREIVYPGMNRIARNEHGGNQVLSHLDTGFNFGAGKGFVIRPFDAFDYITQQEDSFKEHGAGALDLSVLGKTLRMIRNELGFNFAKCFCFDTIQFTLDAKLSWVREVRLKGAAATSQFVGTGVHFTTTGYYPDRSLFSPGLSLTYVALKDRSDLTASLYYNGEFGSGYSDQSLGLQVGFEF